MDSMQIHTIATVSSPFTQKFGIPRQPGLAPSITAQIILGKEYSSPEAVEGLQDCSHIWLLFVFSQAVEQGWKPRVRPPRLGGNQKLGVFASRSPFRPNHIGMSVVELITIEMRDKQLVLTVSGADLLDGTPIIDIKPYLPYADSLPQARYPLASSATLLTQKLVISNQAEQQITSLQGAYPCDLEQQISELLRCDPRPAYQNDPERVYGVYLYDLNIRFSVNDTKINLLSIDKREA